MLQRIKGRDKPRFGLICCVNSRGLGTEGRNLRSIFARYFGDFEFSLFPLPTGKSAYAFDARSASDRRFGHWLQRQDIVMAMEVFMPRVFARCRARGIRCLWRPNQEWIEPQYGAADFAAVDLILAPQQDCARMLRSRFALDNVTCIPWILDKPVQAKPVSAGDTRFVFNAGRGGVGDRRNAALVCDGFRQVLAERDDVRLTIKSQVELDLGPLQPHVGGAVQYVRRKTGYARNLAYYAQADFSLAPSKWEGVGLALLESLHCGTPVLTLDAPPMNEWVQHRRTGYLVPAERADVPLPLPLDGDRRLGVNWTPAALARAEDLAAGVHWLVEHRHALYERFNRLNRDILVARKQAFLSRLRAALEPTGSVG